MNRPVINVTPLIDVLLVLLIIFMVITPPKPSRFEAKIPSEPKNTDGTKTNPLTLVVALDRNSSLAINSEKDFGTVENPEKLVAKLRSVFQERKANGVYSESALSRRDLSEDEKIEKTVFIKAPKNASYGAVAKLIDAVKSSGAAPISLQIDQLD